MNDLLDEWFSFVVHVLGILLVKMGMSSVKSYLFYHSLYYTIATVSLQTKYSVFPQARQTSRLTHP